MVVTAGDANADPRGGSETVLVVEDEEIVRSLLRELLEGLGYSVLDASDGEEALRSSLTTPRGSTS